jgi:hypothetical protein
MHLTITMSFPESQHHEWERLMRNLDPVLPVLDTIELIVKMPEGKWTTPEPYKRLDHKEMMPRKVDSLILPWIDYLGRADRGRELSRKFREEGIVTGDVASYKAFDFFRKIDVINGETHEEKINSVRRGFASLISPERRKEEGLPESIEASENDILNAKRFVDVTGRKLIGFRLPGLEEE